ncbi:MAG: T9SS type A sorting domain-containing protein [bacterium]|nr:T9SS type A sorting domain-containing protein [bacterium]
MLLGILLLCITVVGLGQPLVVEWNNLHMFENPTLRVWCSDLCVDAQNQSFYAVGQYFERDEEGGESDSGDAWAGRFGLDGEPIWLRTYSEPFPSGFQSVESAADGGIWVGGSGFRLCHISTEGDITCAPSFCDFLGLELSDIKHTNNAQTIVGGRCVTIDDQHFLESSHVIALDEDGNSVWNAQFDSSYYSCALTKLGTTSTGNVLALVDYFHFITPMIARISNSGIVISESPTLYEPLDALFNDDGSYFYLSEYMGFAGHRIVKIDALDQTEFDVRAPSSTHTYGWSRISRTSSGSIILSGWYVELSGVSENGDSLWYQQLPSDRLHAVEPTFDGGLLAAFEFVNDEQGVFGVRLMKLSLPVPRPEVNIDTLVFPLTQVGSVSSVPVLLSNSGIDSFQLIGVVCPDGFSSSFESPIWVREDESSEILFEFRPTEARFYQDDVTFTIVSPNMQLSVHVIGDARTSNVSNANSEFPHFAIEPPYPNPFNAVTSIEFELPSSAYVALNVYDVQGRLVTTLMDEVAAAGVHSVSWACAECASGLYFVRMKAGEFVATQKVLLVK